MTSETETKCRWTKDACPGLARESTAEEYNGAYRPCRRDLAPGARLKTFVPRRFIVKSFLSYYIDVSILHGLLVYQTVPVNILTFVYSPSPHNGSAGVQNSVASDGLSA